MPWIIGDIHGCLRELNILLERIPSEEQLIFLGDYIDRGPDSKGVIDRLLLEKGRSVFLMGNHEAMMLEHFKSPASEIGWLYEINGGRPTLASYGLKATSGSDRLPPDHLNFFRNLRLFYEGDDFIAVHAGFRISRGLDPNKQRREDMLWIREEWIAKLEQWKGKYVYYGHTPTHYIESGRKGPLIGQNSCAVDTGCVYGGNLTAIHHPDHRIIQVPSTTRWR